MNSTDAKVKDVGIGGGFLAVSLDDGRVIRLPLCWYPSLAEATPAERARWRQSAAGRGIHWPALDYDLGIDGLLQGAREARGVLELTRRFRSRHRAPAQTQRRGKVRPLVGPPAVRAGRTRAGIERYFAYALRPMLAA